MRRGISLRHILRRLIKKFSWLALGIYKSQNQTFSLDSSGISVSFHNGHAPLLQTFFLSIWIFPLTVLCAKVILVAFARGARLILKVLAHFIWWWCYSNNIFLVCSEPDAAKLRYLNRNKVISNIWSDSCHICGFMQNWSSNSSHSCHLHLTGAWVFVVSVRVCECVWVVGGGGPSQVLRVMLMMARNSKYGKFINSVKLITVDQLLKLSWSSLCC